MKAKVEYFYIRAKLENYFEIGGDDQIRLDQIKLMGLSSELVEPNEKAACCKALGSSGQ